MLTRLFRWPEDVRKGILLCIILLRFFSPPNLPTSDRFGDCLTWEKGSSRARSTVKILMKQTILIRRPPQTWRNLFKNYRFPASSQEASVVITLSHFIGCWSSSSLFIGQTQIVVTSEICKNYCVCNIKILRAITCGPGRAQGTDY